MTDNKDPRNIELEFTDIDIRKKSKTNLNKIDYLQIEEEKESSDNQIQKDEKVSNIDPETHQVKVNGENSKTPEKEEKESTIDLIIDEEGINWYNMRIFIILSLFYLADGAEMIVISLLITKLGQEWSLSDTKKGIMGSAVFVGFFIGALVSGKLSDTRGRKPVFIIGALIVGAFSTLSAFALDYYSFLALRAINGFGIGISIPSSTALAAEITPKSWRAWVLSMVWIFFPIGEVFAVVLARAILDWENGWRYLLGFAGIPAVIAFLISFFIFESPKFYLATKQYEKAFNGINRILSIRKKPEMSQEIKDKIKSENELSIQNDIKANFKTLLTKEYFGVTVKTCAIFYICSFIYYGVVYILPQTMEAVSLNNLNNSTSLLNNTINNSTLFNLTESEKEKMYTGVIYASLSELPSTLITGYVANVPFLGRIGSMGYGFIFTLVAAVLCGLFLNSLTFFAAFLKFAIDIPFGVIYIYVSEAFPTKIRSIALGVTNSFNRIGGITTPIFSQLALSMAIGMPYYLYAVTALIAAVITFMLPFETLGRSID